jgi:hypothetical protein
MRRLLIASAGSAGTRERVHAARHPDAVRLWPSFNLVSLTENEVRVESVSFSPKPTARPPIRRLLASASREGPKWKPEPVTFRVKDPAPRVAVDEADYELQPSTASPGRWDFSCERRVEPCGGAGLRRYVDFVHALPRGAGAPRRGNRHFDLTIGGVTRYSVPGGLRRTRSEGSGAGDAGVAFEWVGLLCRYGAVRATLRLARVRAEGIDPFGSVTDLTIGRERPVTLQVTSDWWLLSAEALPPRTLMRIYWPLAEP